MTDVLANLDFGEFEIKLDDAFQYIETALMQLDSCCDGAVTEDAIGFAGQHTRKGKRLAAKLHSGGSWQLKEMVWCKNALPYYFNTQLNWVDKELFKVYCDLAIEHLKQVELEKERRAQERADKVAQMQDAELIEIFVNISLMSGKDKVFITSLQNWIKTRGSFTPKQLVYVRKFVAEYGELK